MEGIGRVQHGAGSGDEDDLAGLLGDPFRSPGVGDIVGEVVQRARDFADALRIARGRVPVQVEYVPVGRPV